MFSFLKPRKSNSSLNNKKPIASLLIIIIISFSFFVSVRPVRAQAVTTVVASVPQVITNTLTKFWDWAKTALMKAGSIAYQRTLSTALNKIAYDTATYIGSGHRGQKPLFVTKDWGAYLGQIGDEAVGQFVESFVNHLNDPEAVNCNTQYKNCTDKCSKIKLNKEKETCNLNCYTKMINCTAEGQADAATAAALNTTPSFNVCHPSSLEAKVKIGLGLVDEKRPQSPNCSGSEILENWHDDINAKLDAMRRTNYLDEVASIFDPRSNDLGIYYSAKADMLGQVSDKLEVKKSALVSKGGWLDVRNIAGNTEGTPDAAKRALETANAINTANFGKLTGDAFVDAANIFLNRLALSSFQSLLRSLAKKDNNSNSNIVNNYQSDPGASYSETAIKEVTSKLLKPKFDIRADYDILSSLSVCPDPKNPGPANCVIDDKFMQAISEKKTIAEAIEEGYLHADWPVTADSSGGSYNNSYSLRNIMILRNYRIVPVGLEEAARRLVATDLPRKATLRDLVSCFSRNDSYNTFSNDFQADHSWCEGLVDPNWVLKAPLNYCQKEGFGAQILNKTVAPGETATSSTLTITRADNYCADNQSCIKEKSDGSCEAYGYCDQEKRTWKFNTDTCQSVDNTCQSFSASDGQQVSYLQNTLDYSNCTPENSGCRQYSLIGNYASSSNTVAWNSTKVRYLNKNLSNCSSRDEACTGLIRVKPNQGENLVMNSDFDTDEIGDNSSGSQLNDWPIYASAGANPNSRIVDSSQDPGSNSGKALKLSTNTGSVGVYSDFNHSLLPNNFQIIPGQAYTISADIYLASGQNVKMFLGGANDGFSKNINTQNEWQHLSVTREADTSYSEANFGITGTADGSGLVFYVKNIKFEMASWDTGYSAYGTNKFYEKILPKYLESSCYTNVNGATKDYSLRPDAPNICFNYARQCNQAEVGCESYTATKDKFKVSAQVTSVDSCPQECLGYDIYVSKETYFNSPSADNIIPDKARSCDATSVGCNEFTNLDSLNQGGEHKEYYTELKQCIKPDQNSCANFYSWEGTNNGYQLKVYSLKKDANGLPAVTTNDSSFCNASIYNLPISDPAYNPDCHEFYNVAGDVSYHLSSKTITCSDNCHAYRMSEKNIDSSVNNASDCNEINGEWDSANNDCIFCLNGGTWNQTADACIYQAIPGEGKTCKASENACREYDGNNGNNVRLLASYDFEGGLINWKSSPAGEISVSTISNNKNGHSLQVNANTSVQLPVSNLVREGADYNVKFLVRAHNDTNLTISFINPSSGETAMFNVIKIEGGNKWNVYQASLTNLNHPIALASDGSDGELLNIEGDNSFYLDDFVLSEVTDRYYLIKGSSKVPNICYYDNLGQYRGPDYNLACAQYVDGNQAQHNLHQFSKLCSDSSVGCEQMIDTKNYTPYSSGYWKGGVATSSCNTITDPDCIKVDADQAIYAVYDESKLCSSSNQGCSRLGKGQGGAHLSAWVDAYKNNNPDEYDNTLCSQDELGCDAWHNKDDGSLSYFKDPGTETCMYRVSNNPGLPGKRWYKIPVKRCDLNGNGKIDYQEGNIHVCSSDSDCGHHKCLIDNNDYECSVSTLKTIGSGGADINVPTPDQAAGLCKPAASSCSEYIDPVSKFSSNLVVNPNHQCSDGICNAWGSTATEKWNGNTLSNIGQQVVKLQANTLYNIQVDYDNLPPSQPVQLEFNNNVRLLDNNNSLASSTNLLTLSDDKAIIFYSSDNTATLISNGQSDRTIKLKSVIVSYQLKNNIDSTSCNGQTKYNNGCVLFNERSVNGSSTYANLSWDAYATDDGTQPVSCQTTGSCTANKLIKVRPDRTCNQWLACTSYIQDPTTKKKTCYSFANCDRLDDKNECANFIDPSPVANNLNPITNANATGYSLLNQYDLSNMKIVGQNIDKVNFDFEDSGAPCFNNGLSSNCVINNPDDAAKVNGIDYPAHGQAYLIVKNNYSLVSNINLGPLASKDLYINYLVNTKGAAGTKALITIDDGNGKVLNLISEANNGWQRKIQPLGKGWNNINISLAATSTSESVSPVYFDDIKIEPVLKTSDSTYVAPECRLYPGSDSPTCFQKNKNVIKDGLKGYCLKHDPINKDVCLLWYPMDSVPVPSVSMLGYTGDFPLNYCTQASGNFDLMEERRAYEGAAFGFYGSNHHICGYSWTDGDNNPVYNNPTTSSDKEVCITSQSNMHKIFCPSICPAPEYKVWFSWKPQNSGNDKSYLKVICIPNKELLDKITSDSQNSTNSLTNDNSNNNNWEACAANVTENWLGADGKHKVYSVGYAKFNGFATTTLVSQAFEKEVRPEDNDPTPNLRVRDNNDNGKIKYIPGTTSNTDLPYFHIQCNELVQTVDKQGFNASWVNRVSTSTLDLQGYNNLYQQPYGRDMAKIPYGAANSNDVHVGTSLLPLRDVELADLQFAGRPYGCDGSSCGSIGVCTGATSTYCLLDQTYGVNLASTTCGNNDTCQALWTNQETVSGAKDVLKNIFLKSLKVFANNNGKYQESPSLSYDYTANGSSSIPECTTSTRPTPIPGNTDPSFCAIYPVISNVNLYYSDSSLKINNPYSISQKGIYRLEFNSLVDSEQQPVNRIIIDWGDGYVQTITNVDNHPNDIKPHVFYHYYYSFGHKIIKIRVYDNWGLYGEYQSN